VLMDSNRARRSALSRRRTTLDSGRCKTNRPRRRNQRTSRILPLRVEEDAADEADNAIVQVEREVLGRVD